MPLKECTLVLPALLAMCRRDRAAAPALHAAARAAARNMPRTTGRISTGGFIADAKPLSVPLLLWYELRVVVLNCEAAFNTSVYLNILVRVRCGNKRRL